MLGTCILNLARSASLREAADVLRTYRRAAGEKRKAEVNGKEWSKHLYKHYVTKCEVQSKALQNMPQKLIKTQSGASPNSLKSKPGTVLGAKMRRRISPEQPRDGQERPRSVQETPKKHPREARSRPRANKSRPSGASEWAKPSQNPPQDAF